MLSYETATDYIQTFLNTEKTPDFSRNARFYNLERIAQLLEELDNPHQHLKIIHITGSKGKGTTATIIASILTHVGYRTGLFTSPHFISPRERCQIDAEMISKADFARCLTLIKPAIESISTNSFGKVSFFEIYTALAFFYFADQQVDFAVVEVGLGGRLDATNVVDPIVSVITQVSLEHTRVLGETLKEIAEEKAEIIKANRPVVIAPQPIQVRPVFEKTAADRAAAACWVDMKHIQQNSQSLNGQFFDFQSKNWLYRNLFIPLIGEHQLINAAVAICCVEKILMGTMSVDFERALIFEGLEKVRLIGRLQLIERRTKFLIDSAHSPASFEALWKTIRELFCYDRLIVVIGLMKDKDLQAIGKIVVSSADEIIATQAFNNPRVCQAEEIVRMWSNFSIKPMRAISSAPQAIQAAQSTAHKLDLICVTGSIYLAGEALKLLQKSP